MLGGHSLVHFLPVHPLGESADGLFTVADGQHDSAVQPSVWPAPHTSPPYPGASEGTDLQGTDSLGCWS